MQGVAGPHPLLRAPEAVGQLGTATDVLERRPVRRRIPVPRELPTEVEGRNEDDRDPRRCDATCRSWPPSRRSGLGVDRGNGPVQRQIAFRTPRDGENRPIHERDDDDQRAVPAIGVRHHVHR